MPSDSDTIKILTTLLNYSLSNGDKVKLTSEFLEHVEPTYPFNSKHGISVAQEPNGAAVILSTGDDDVSSSWIS